MQELLNIYKVCCQAAFGGLIDLEYVPTDYIDEFPHGFELQNQMEIKEPIVLKPDLTWLKVSCYPESIKFDEKSRDNKQGEYIQTIISGYFPSKSNDIRRLYDRLRRVPVVLKFITTDKDTLIVGSKKTPLNFDLQNVRGEKIKDGHRFSFSFSGKTEYLAFIYNP